MDTVIHQSHLKDVATTITSRIAENTVRTQFTRYCLGGEFDGNDQPFDEERMVRDATRLALGEDTGCLTEEDISPDTVDLLFVEQALAEIERGVRDRCFHDFLGLLTAAQADCPTPDGRDALRFLAVGVQEIGPDGLGSGRCECGTKICPYGQIPADRPVCMRKRGAGTKAEDN